jgi:aspartate racemase
VAYYEAICRAARSDGEVGSPEMTIESLDMAKTLAARGTPDNPASWTVFDNFFQQALTRLHSAGCDFAAIASVTPHSRLTAISEGSPLPIVSIVDAVAAKLHGSFAKEAVVLGTSVTMEGALFDDMLIWLGMNVRRAQLSEIAAFGDLLDTYFYKGRAAEGRKALIRYVREFYGGNEDLLCILACTDLAPAFPDTTGQTVFAADGINFFDATAAHVDAILAATSAKSDQIQKRGT